VRLLREFSPAPASHITSPLSRQASSFSTKKKILWLASARKWFSE
jgi:hypothetical protein